jgi:hypothetical protein
VIGCERCWERCRLLFEDDYEKDPARAKAMYEARPSRAINPYFSNPLPIEQAFKQAPAPLSIGYRAEIPGRTWAPDYEFAPFLVPIQGAQYAMHADLAISGDMAGIALAHVKHWEDREVVGQDAAGADVVKWETRPVVKVDFLAAFSADKRAQPVREIQIRWARLLCLELIRRGFNIRLFSCDGFESADSRQIMETQYGLETHVVSTDRASMIKADGISQGEALWRNLRDLASEARLLIPGSGIFYDRCLNELLALSRMPNGKIDHPPGGSKDIADGLAGACGGAIYLGGREDEEGTQAHPGSGLDNWAGMPVGGLDGLPIGFVVPDSHKYSEPIDHVPVTLDGTGRPIFAGGAYDWGEVPEHQP